MTLVTGNSNLNKTGFTLVELVLTAIIVLVIIGLSVPVFKKTFSDLRVNLLAKDVAGLLNLAREKAIMTRQQHLIKVDADKKTYRMYMRVLDKDEIVPAEGRWGRSFKIPHDIVINVSSDTVEFFPDGSSGGVDIYFTDVSLAKSAVKVDAGTGEVHAGEGK